MGSKPSSRGSTRSFLCWVLRSRITRRSIVKSHVRSVPRVESKRDRDRQARTKVSCTTSSALSLELSERRANPYSSPPWAKNASRRPTSSEASGRVSSVVLEVVRSPLSDATGRDYPRQREGRCSRGRIRSATRTATTHLIGNPTTARSDGGRCGARRCLLKDRRAGRE